MIELIKYNGKKMQINKLKYKDFNKGTLSLVFFYKGIRNIIFYKDNSYLIVCNNDNMEHFYIFNTLKELKKEINFIFK